MTDLMRHYGLNHKMLFVAMQTELGENWKIDDQETNDCKICSQVFLNNRLLMDHYCGNHFYAKLSEGLPNMPPFQCPSCSFNSKTHLALVRHVGNKHKLVKKFLFEAGYEKASSISRRSTSQDSNSYFYNQQWQENQYPSTPYARSFGSPGSGFTSPQHQMCHFMRNK